MLEEVASCSYYPEPMRIAADADRLQRLQALTDTALAHLDLGELLEALLVRARELLSADTCAVLLLDEESDELVARAAVGIEEEVEAGVRIPMGGGFAGRVAAGRQPVILDDVNHAHVVNPILRQKGIKSMLGVPLLVADRVIGVLHVGTLVHRRFTPDDVRLLSLVAERVAVAIERAELHAKTMLLDQLKLNFVAIASHELRTPTTAVYGALATVRARDLSDETRTLLIDTAFEQADRLRMLLEQLLDLSRLDSETIAVAPRPIVLRSVLEEIVAATVPGDVPVEFDIPADLAAVADPVVLDRIVSNLLTNAVRHGAPPIRIVAERRDRHLYIAVEDSGEGVPPQLRPRLFERFARTEAGPGSGLGLAIARSYAHAHGGDLVYLDGDRGARFELIVPQA